MRGTVSARVREGLDELCMCVCVHGYPLGGYVRSTEVKLLPIVRFSVLGLLHMKKKNENHWKKGGSAMPCSVCDSARVR